MGQSVREQDSFYYRKGLWKRRETAMGYCPKSSSWSSALID
ncbi:unnamed protein product [Rhodiola kirilowii]